MKYLANGKRIFQPDDHLLVSFLSAKAVVEGNITLGMIMSISYIIENSLFQSINDWFSRNYHRRSLPAATLARPDKSVDE
jgi:hypothetical protein